ncbi:MAG: hypothetical protein ACI8U0_002261 [Flavobacteriales bacterium]|jgi:hypothetical protein
MQRANVEITPKKYISTITTIHLALVSGILMFGAVIYFQNDDWTLNFSETKNIFFYIVPLLGIVGIVGGNFFFKTQMEGLKSKPRLLDKVNGHKKAMIIKFAFIEAPALLGIMSSMQSGNLFYLIVAGLLFVYFISLKPTKSKIEESLALDSKLKDQFNMSDKVID